MDNAESSQSVPESSDLITTEAHHFVFEALSLLGYKETLHCFEREGGRFFDADHIADLIRNGKWVEADKYLHSFTTPISNEVSANMFLEIRKLKYMEALNRGAFPEARSILVDELRIFKLNRVDQYNELLTLMELPNFSFDVKTARIKLVSAIPELVKANADLVTKLELPWPACG